MGALKVLDNMGYTTYNMCEGVVRRPEIVRFEVEFFERADGTYPAEEFIMSQDMKMRAKIYRLIELLEERGSELREPYSKLLEDGIFGLRAKQGSYIARVLYFLMVGRKIILTNGFVKKTQKTPSGGIELAKKYREEFDQNER